MAPALVPANGVLAGAPLSVPGVGIHPACPGWGRMIADGLPPLRSEPMLVRWPVVLLGAGVLAFTFLGEALRDALDPRLRP